MFWTRATRLAGFALACATAASVSAGTIVIRSSGPSAHAYPAGRALADGERIALKTGDTLVVLDARGTRTLAGAGIFDIGASAHGTAAPSTFAALIGNSGARQVRTGAVRGQSSGPAHVASLWYVDTAKSGTVCLKDMSQTSLWRSAMTDPATLTLTRTSDGKSASVAFTAGQAVHSWPTTALPITPGTEYRISGLGMARPTSVRFAAFASASDAPDDVASGLIARGCTGQLDALVEAGRTDASQS